MNNITFKDLGLTSPVLDALDEKGFVSPTPIQEKTIPIFLSNSQDIIGQAQTGTGKTAAFGLPILEMLEPNQGHIQALILAPTRELAVQVADELHGLKGKKPLRITTVYGGQSIDKQRKELSSNPDIVVGTPGRVMDHMRSKKIDLMKIRFFVLDEADEMLNSGFIEDIEWILEKANPKRRVLLFSATMPPQILRLAETYMGDYETITVKKQVLDQPLTKQIFYEVKESDKYDALCRIIDLEDEFYGLAFCRTKREVDLVSSKLIQQGYKAEAMHGDLNQFQRERVLTKLKKRLCTILVVTDVAARGLDINDLSHVINMGLPQDAESYVHRVGRTGRAGKTGTAITLISPSEFHKLMRIKKISKMDSLEKADVPTPDMIVNAKRSQIKDKIEDAIRMGVDDEYIQLAKSVLNDNDPTTSLAGLLKVAFQDAFSAEKYRHIEQGKSLRRSDRGDGPRRDHDRDRGRGFRKGRGSSGNRRGRRR